SELHALTGIDEGAVADPGKRSGRESGSTEGAAKAEFVRGSCREGMDGCHRAMDRDGVARFLGQASPFGALVVLRAEYDEEFGTGHVARDGDDGCSWRRGHAMDSP